MDDIVGELLDTQECPGRWSWEVSKYDVDATQQLPTTTKPAPMLPCWPQNCWHNCRHRDSSSRQRSLEFTQSCQPANRLGRQTEVDI